MIWSISISPHNIFTHIEDIILCWSFAKKATEKKRYSIDSCSLMKHKMFILKAELLRRATRIHLKLRMYCLSLCYRFNPLFKLSTQVFKCMQIVQSSTHTHPY